MASYIFRDIIHSQSSIQQCPQNFQKLTVHFATEVSYHAFKLKFDKLLAVSTNGK